MLIKTQSKLINKFCGFGIILQFKKLPVIPNLLIGVLF